MRQNLGSLDQFVSLTLHQRVIRRDVGLALGAVDQQCFNPPRRPWIQLHGGGKAGATHAGNARRPHLLHQRGGVQTSPVGRTGEGQPLILTIGFDHNALVFKSGCVGDGPGFDRRDNAGRWGVHRHTHNALCRGNRLAPEYTLTNAHDWLSRHAKVLAQRQH